MLKEQYVAKVQRWFVVVLTVAGCILSALVSVRTLMSGSATGCFSRLCMVDHGWTIGQHPTQFWFYVLFWLAAAVAFGRMAWKAWRD
jgi:hypothetical protein